MELSNEFWIQIVVYAASFAVMWGQISTRVKHLEEKMDKHNSVIERVYKLEESAKSAHKRIDEVKEECSE